MNELELRYLKKNNFSKYLDGEYTSYVIQNYVLADSLDNVHGFCDEKQIGLIKVQFAELYPRISWMKITVRHINLGDYEVKLTWQIDGKKEEDESSISGEGLYELISQAIVLANVNDF